MIVFATFATRKGYPDEPELVEAWDEYCVDNNPDGYGEAVAKALASWGDELAEHRLLRLIVPDAALDRAFAAPLVAAQVAP